jgi:HD-GYP domain-containing protein (c-di-GMP phosphodiesterase class II)
MLALTSLERRRPERRETSPMMALQLLSRAVEARDAYTRGHAARVGEYSAALAQALGCSERMVEECRVGGRLHDIGKVGIPDAVLHKPAALARAERKIMRSHPEIGAAIVGSVPFLRPVLPCVLCHHERWDGKGYPGKLKGTEIPLHGRICAVADAFDAMTSSRPYRAAQSLEFARAELIAGRNTQFDPACVDAFVGALDAGAVFII